MPENMTYTIFDNDYLEYCKAVAQDYPDTIYDFFPNFPQDTDGMDDLLETIGLDEDEAEEFLDEIRAENREDGLDLLVEKIQATVKTDSERRNVESFFEDQMLNEDVQWFSECFDDQCQEDVITGYDMISIDPKEPHLCLGSDMGWRNLSGYSIMKPKENIAQSLMESFNTDTIMKITYTEGDPCLRAKAYTHDSPMGESYTIIPQSMARKAF